MWDWRVAHHTSCEAGAPSAFAGHREPHHSEPLSALSPSPRELQRRLPTAPGRASPPNPSPAPRPRPRSRLGQPRHARTPTHTLPPPSHRQAAGSADRPGRGSRRKGTTPATGWRASPGAPAPGCRSPRRRPPSPGRRRPGSTAPTPASLDRSGSSAPSSRQSAAAGTPATRASAAAMDGTAPPGTRSTRSRRARSLAANAGRRYGSAAVSAAMCSAEL